MNTALRLEFLRTFIACFSREFSRLVSMGPRFGAALLLSIVTALAQSAGTGTIDGHIQNKVTGDFLNNARVSVKGSTLVTLTDDSGYYRLNGVPAGEVALRVFFTGLDEKEVN